jgi:hypothetical protein
VTAVVMVWRGVGGVYQFEQSALQGVLPQLQATCPHNTPIRVKSLLAGPPPATPPPPAPPQEGF